MHCNADRRPGPHAYSHACQGQLDMRRSRSR